MINVATKGKGAIKDKRDLRNYRFDMVFGVSTLPTEFSLRDIASKFKVKDQGTSESCGGQAFAYHMQIKSYLRDNKVVELSAHDLYAPVHVQEGGSRASDLLSRLANNGIAEESDIPSYRFQSTSDGNPAIVIAPDESFMQHIEVRTPEIDNRAMQYWINQTYLTFSSLNPEQVKQAIYQGKSAVIAILGNNICWISNSGIVEVPNKESVTWGHFLCLIGWKIINGVLHFEFINSWGEEWGDKGFGYLPTRYLTSGLGYNEWIVSELEKDKYSSMIKLITMLKNLIELLRQKLHLW